MSRREFLTKVGLAGGVGLVGATAMDRYVGDELEPDQPPDRPEDREDPVGTEAPPDEAAVPYEDRYSTVVDAVAEGADPEGGDPINDVLREHAADDTLLAFAPGTYRYERFELTDLTHVGITGRGEKRPTFVPTDGDCMGGRPYAQFGDVADLLLSDLDFDFRESGGGGAIHAFLTGENVVRNLRFRGSCGNQLSMIRLDVRDEAGTALIEGLEAENTGANHSLTGVYVGKHHEGEVTFRNCHLDGFSDNGLYASAPGLEDGGNGTVHVEGGTFSNNNISNVRLGSAGSTCDDVTVRVDRTPPGWGQLNARGIRFRGQKDQVVRNCEVTMGPDGADSFGAIVFHPANNGATIRDTTIQVDKDAVPAIRAFATATESSGRPVFENLTITGSASRGVVASLEGRPGTIFRDCTIEQSGTDRAGIRLANSPDCTIEGCRIETDTDPIVLERSSAEVRDTTIVTPAGERRLDDRRYENEVLTPA